MNKYRIEITGPREGSFVNAEVYEAYGASTAEATADVLATRTIAPLVAVGDAVQVDVKLIKVNLNRSKASCKRVQ